MTPAIRRLGVAIVVGLGLCAAVGAITWNASRDTIDHRTAPSGGRAKAGTYDVYDTVTVGSLATVRLPTGTLHLEFGTDAHGVDENGIDGRSNLRPPRGGRFVWVGNTFDRSTSPLPAEAVSGDDPEPMLTLISDGHRYPVPEAGSADKVIAVATDPAHTSLEVAYDGVAQTVQLGTGRVRPGRAAPLYAKPVAGSSDCGTAMYPAHYAASTTSFPSSCRIDWQRVPFVTGQGWAPADSDYLVVAVTTGGPAMVTRVDGAARGALSTYLSGSSTIVDCGSAAAKPLHPSGSTSGSDRDSSASFTCRAASSTGPAVPLTIRKTVLVAGSAGGREYVGSPVHLTWTVVL